MKLDTIIYLHELLKADVEKKQEARQASAELAYKYEEAAEENHDPMSKDLARRQRDFARDCFADLMQAQDALYDMEAHDFR